MQVQIYEFSAKQENIFGIICFSANFDVSQQRKNTFLCFRCSKICKYRNKFLSLQHERKGFLPAEMKE